MATNKQELGNAIVRIFDIAGQEIDPQNSKVLLAQQLASEIDLYTQNQIRASLVPIQDQIDQLRSLVLTLQSAIALQTSGS